MPAQRVGNTLLIVKTGEKVFYKKPNPPKVVIRQGKRLKVEVLSTRYKFIVPDPKLDKILDGFVGRYKARQARNHSAS
jgi:hypothetical protein